MKKYTLILVAVVAILLTSCASINNQLSAGSNMTKVQLSMTKDEVVKIMGRTYEVVGSRQTNEGSEETIGYLDAYNDIYMLTFLNGRLVEYHKEWLPKPRTEPMP